MSCCQSWSGWSVRHPGSNRKCLQQRLREREAPTHQPIIGDFFRELLSGAHLYLLKFILHDSADEGAAKIPTNIRKAITPTGRLAAVEIVLPAGNEPHVGRLIDLNMMVMTGGAERTEAEYAHLLRARAFDSSAW